MTTETIIFRSPNDKAFQIDTGRAVTYIGTNKFNDELCKNPFKWNQIIIHHHNGKYNKDNILKALFDAVANNSFFPIAYRSGNKSDKFLVRKCYNALQKLFQNKLMLIMPDNQKIQLTVKLNVGEYEKGQINPESKIYKAIMTRFNHLTKHNQINNVLDLENFALSPELMDVQINLGNQYIFNLICETIAKQHDVINSINGLNLSNNNIKSLIPMKLFAKAQIQMIDLRLNNIISMNDIENLKCIEFTDLFITGNPIEQNETDLYDRLKKHFPKLLHTDVIYTKNISNNIIDTPKQIDAVAVEQNGRQIEVNDLIALERLRDNDSWHKITVQHQGKYNKAEITEAFFEFYRKSEIEFFPCYYNSGPTKDTFLVRNCYENLKILMLNDLKLPLLNYDSLTLKLTMEIGNFERGHVEPIEIITSAAAECFNLMDRCLHLENFKSSKSLKHLILNMSNPKTNFQILNHCGRKYSNNIIEVHLNKNNISSCKGLKALETMGKLKVLDLSDNNIKTINDLECIPKKSIKEIKEVRLDGNPLCANYVSSTSYIKAIKNLFPNINKLDGILIDSGMDLISRKNYLVDMEYYDLVEQFVSNYFTAYDCVPDRKDIIGMYHANAIFTITFNYDTKNMYTQQRSKTYIIKQRNFQKLSDLDNVYKNLYIGHDQISTVLTSLPQTDHDFLSFTTDTTIIKKNVIAITVTGVFKDIPVDKLLDTEILFAFSRTFIIRITETNVGIFNCSTEYQIVNDHLYISTPTPLQSRNCFKYKNSLDNSAVEANTTEEKELFTIMFEQILGLKRVWCSRCLNDGNWNFKKSLEVFLTLMTENKIPSNAFIEISD